MGIAKKKSSARAKWVKIPDLGREKVSLDPPEPLFLSASRQATVRDSRLAFGGCSCQGKERCSELCDLAHPSRARCARSNREAKRADARIIKNGASSTRRLTWRHRGRARDCAGADSIFHSIFG